MRKVLCDMKAAFIQKFGSTDVLEIGERPKPEIKPDQVLIEVHAASVNPRDCLIRSGKYPIKISLPKFPMILGSDVAGVVAEVGTAIRKFKIGDEVYAMQTAFGGFGAYAEFMAIKESAVGLKPKNMSFEEASAVPCAGLTAWQALLHDCKLKPRQTVLIVGASGSVGSFGVQIAKDFGAAVVGVCSTRNVDLVRSLGADEVVDYTKEKFNDSIRGIDIILDTLGKENLAAVESVLKPQGIYITTLPHGKQMLDTVRTGILPFGQKSKMVMVKAKGSDLDKIKEKIEAGKIRAVIDKVYPLEQVAEAHQYSSTFHTQGKLILKIKA